MSKKADTHRRVLSFITTVRGSFPCSAIIYTHGACYGLFQILREVWPSARAFMSKDEEHIVTLIGGRYYDILGEWVKLNGKTPEGSTELTPAQHEYWVTVASGQRVECMIKKYNK